MRRAVVVLVALLVVVAVAPARGAGKVSVGTNLGLSHYLPEHGDGLTTFGWPRGTESTEHLFAPGLRLGVGLDEGNARSIYLDSGVSVWSGSDVTISMAQFMAGYQHAFQGPALQPYLTGGVGFMFTDYDGESVSNPVLGLGVGLRHVLSHGGGAVRAEIHFDHQFEGRHDEYTAVPALNVIGLKLGFDLNL